MTFQPGVSGNPAGKPKGTKDKRTALRDLLTPHAAELVKRCVDLAKQGDPTALSLCIDRLMAPVREHPIKVEVPKIESAADCVKAQASIIAAVAAGEMLPGEAQALSGLIDSQRKAYEANEFAKRLDALERFINQAAAGAGTPCL